MPLQGTIYRFFVRSPQRGYSVHKSMTLMKNYSFYLRQKTCKKTSLDFAMLLQDHRKGYPKEEARILNEHP